MRYTPTYFTPEEFFPPNFLRKFLKRGAIFKPEGGNNVYAKIWRYMDERAIWTADALRKKYGITYINTWTSISLPPKQRFQYRGFRPFAELFDHEYYKQTGNVRLTVGGLTSQHVFGKAFDCHFKDISVDKVREEMQDNPKEPAFKFIRGCELDVNWLHVDFANRSGGGIVFYKP
jgi:hypothetical protein